MSPASFVANKNLKQCLFSPHMMHFVRSHPGFDSASDPLKAGPCFYFLSHVVIRLIPPSPD